MALQPKLAILGAGPAGSALALGLVARGVDPGDLLVLDKARFPRPKLCGGGVTFRGTEVLGRLLGSEAASLGLTTKDLLFTSKAGVPLTVREKGAQWVYDRSVLDSALLAKVKASGVEVREETTVTGLEPTQDGWRVRTGASSIVVPWVAGCDGATGLSRRAAELPGGVTGRLVEAVFERAGSDRRDDQLVFDFDPILDGIPGYAWIFPYKDPETGQTLFKLGVMDGRGKAPGEELRRWTLRFAEREGFRCLEPKVSGYPERYYHPRAKSHRPGLVLVGEAYGIDPLLGEGIAPALFHAEHVAEHLVRAWHRGTRDVPGIDRAYFHTPEGRNLWFQWHLAERLYGRHPERWLHVLFGMERLRELAAGGQDAYGRLFHRIPTFMTHFAWQLLTRGMPKARPLPAATNGAALRAEETRT